MADDLVNILKSFIECVAQGMNIYHALQDQRERRERRQENEYKVKKLLEECDRMSRIVPALRSSSSHASAILPTCDLDVFADAVEDIKKNFMELHSILKSLNNLPQAEHTEIAEVSSSHVRKRLRTLMPGMNPVKGGRSASHEKGQRKMIPDSAAISELCTSFENIKLRVENVRSFKSLLDHVAVESNRTIRENQREHEKTREVVISRLPLALNPDKFKPFFFLAENPPGVVLDFSLDNDGRPTTLEGQLKQAVLENQSISKAVSAAGKTLLGVTGVGGVGKTCALSGVARAKDVQGRFPGGVYWISLGQHADDSTYVAELAKIVKESGGLMKSDEIKSNSNANEATKDAAVWFSQCGTACLFVCDDMWSSPDRRHGHFPLVRLLALPETGSMVLLSTRQHAISASTRAIQFGPRERKSSVARRMLLGHIGLSDNIVDTSYKVAQFVDEILEGCCGFPIALAVAGSAIRLQSSIRNMEVRDAIENDELKGCVFDVVQDEGLEYGSLYGAINMSLETLDVDGPDRIRFQLHTGWKFSNFFRALCVLEKQAVVSYSILGYLWRHTQAEVGLITVELAGASLITLATGDASAICVHDLVHDVAVRLACAKFEVGYWNEMLLGGYQCVWEEADVGRFHDYRQWWRVTNDGYIYNNLARHLIGAEQLDELVSLLIDDRWLRAQLREGGILRVEADFARCCEALLKRGNDESLQDVVCLRRISKAITLSSVFCTQNAVEKEFSFQMLGRLRGGIDDVPMIQRFLRLVAQHAVSPWVEPLLRFLPSPDSVIEKSISLNKDGECVALYDDDKKAAVGCDDGGILIVDLDVRDVLYEMGGDCDLVWCMAVAPNERLLLTGHRDGTICVWDLERNERVGNSFKGHTKDVNCIVVTRNGKCFVSGSDDGTIRMWDLGTRQQIGDAIRAHDGGVHCLAVTGGSRYVWSGGQNGGIRVWEIESQVEDGEAIMECGDAVLCLAMTPNGKRMICGNLGGIYVLDVESRQQIEDVARERGYRAAVTRDGNRIVISTYGKICMYEVAGMRPVCPLVFTAGNVNFAMFNGGDRFIFFSSEKVLSTANIIEEPLSTRQVVAHADKVRCIDAVHGRRRIVSGARDGTILVWDVDTCEIVNEKEMRHSRCVNCVAVTPNGKCALSGGRGGNICVWDLDTFKAIGEELGDVSDLTVWCMSVSYDNKLVASGYDDGTIRIYDLCTCRQVGADLKGHSDAVNCLAFALDNNLIVSGGYDKAVRVWELDGGSAKERLVLFDHDSDIRTVAFLPNCSVIVSVCFNDVIRQWDVETGECMSIEQLRGAATLNQHALLEYVSLRSLEMEEIRSVWVLHDSIVTAAENISILATCEEPIASRRWCFVKECNTLCAGFNSGQVSFMKIHFVPEEFVADDVRTVEYAQ